MKSKRFKPFPREPWTRIFGIPVVGCILVFGFHEPPYRWQDVLSAILTTGAIWQTDYLLMGWFRTRFPGVENTPRRVFWTILTIFAVNLMLDPFMCYLTFGLGLCENPELHVFTQEGLQKNLGTTLIIGTLYEAGYFFEQWKRQSFIAEEALSRQLKSELNVLKNQVSPHFLFNSLNTLATLIDENPNKASEFTQKLSRVYRYILQYKDEELIDLGTELDFVLDYFALMRMRFENGLILRLNLDDSVRLNSIPPLTLQILVENAIKHNVVSATRPLTIEISSEAKGSLVVRNNWQPKRQAEPSTGTGLLNIQKRFELFSERGVDVINTHEHFVIVLPLLEPLVSQRIVEP